MNEELFAFLQAHDDDSAPDGAWQAMIEDGVVAWNEDRGTNLDPFDTFVRYLTEETKRENQRAYDSVSTGGSHREDT